MMHRNNRGFLPELIFLAGEVLLAVGVGRYDITLGMIAGGLLLMLTGWIAGL